MLNGCASTTVPSSTSARQTLDIEASPAYPSATLNEFIAELFDVLQRQDEKSYLAMWDANEFAERSVGLMASSPYNANLVRNTLLKKDLFARLTNSNLAIFKDAQLILLDSDKLQIKIRIKRGHESLYTAIVVSQRDGQYKIVDLLDYGIGVYQSQKSASLFAHVPVMMKRNEHRCRNLPMPRKR
ncbi:hypothetical protein [Psychromonas sp. MME2]|uniref:hypothetical protein n=1 Tax=Psychromonas sp. MME2 TaxID=3231033 RepID=UPI00339C6254